MGRLQPAFLIASSAGYVAMYLFTLPYYRFFRQNTLLPIHAIATHARLQTSEVELAEMVSSWRDRKLHELYFVQVASTLLSAAVIGCFSWEPRELEHWIGPAARYCSLVLSLFAILLSASQSFIFTTTNVRQARSRSFLSREVSNSSSSGVIAMICRIAKDSPESLLMTTAKPRSRGGEVDDCEKGEAVIPGSKPAVHNVKVSIRWNMVFTWQAPIMLLAYSMIAFLLGLTVYICTPLYSKGSRGIEAAIFYLASLAIGGFCFMWCSFWAYKFVDLDEP
ncbi:hypothetical protein F4776DRAFT_167932 [Hypoxylon sp. NC0597]|nr:hypothetical protein F4776DRAFT_167932 [Hypoxylon sp. NC0597]